jgi:hypothetical protein
LCHTHVTFGADSKTFSMKRVIAGCPGAIPWITGWNWQPLAWVCSRAGDTVRYPQIISNPKVFDHVPHSSGKLGPKDLDSLRSPGSDSNSFKRHLVFGLLGCRGSQWLGLSFEWQGMAQQWTPVRELILGSLRKVPVERGTCQASACFSSTWNGWEFRPWWAHGSVAGRSADSLPQFATLTLSLFVWCTLDMFG